MVANTGLQKAKAQVPGTNGLMSHPKDMTVRLPLLLNISVRAEKSLLPVGPEPGTSGSAVQCFGHQATLANNIAVMWK